MCTLASVCADYAGRPVDRVDVLNQKLWVREGRASGPKVKPIFFYGTLRDPGLLAVVLGRSVTPDRLVPASVENHVALRHLREAYPVLRPRAGGIAEGALFHPETMADRDRLAFFEEAEYRLVDIVVTTPEGRVDAEYFDGMPKAPVSDVPWDFELWKARHRAVAIEAARELMDHFGRLSGEEVDRIWPGIMNRARARALALAAPMPTGPLRTTFGRGGDIEILAHRRSWTGYLAVEEHVLRHRRHDGGWTHPLERTSVSWGDAVTLVPYDPRRDCVLLIEQFRPGPAARGDPSPWCIEVIAGRIDAEGSPEATVRREAREEAGLEIGRIEQVPGYYPTPGLASEHLTAFVGEAGLPGECGLHGLADEGEDIRTIVLTLDDALAALDRGEVNTGPAMILLLWLARHRERLRREWG